MHSRMNNLLLNVLLVKQNNEAHCAILTEKLHSKNTKLPVNSLVCFSGYQYDVWQIDRGVIFQFQGSTGRLKC